MIAVQSVFSQRIDPENLLIRNVKLLTTSNEEKLEFVDLFIANGKLNQVSRDPLIANDDMAVLDARKGILVGKLEINKPPSFIILRKDPRLNFDIWFNMEQNIIFAIDGQVLHRNRLWRGNLKPDKKVPKMAKVFTYTPPPFSLPIEFGEVRWNHWETPKFSGLFTAVIGLDRQFWFNQNSASENVIGKLKNQGGGIIRGFRFGSIGQFVLYKSPWSYTIFGATTSFEKEFDSNKDDALVLFDYRLDIPISNNLLLSIGKQKEPFSLERLSPSHLAAQQERTAASDAFLRARNIGVQISGNFLNDRGTWASGIFNPWIENDGGISQNATTLVGRVTALPFISSDENQLVHIGLGGRFSQGIKEIRFKNTPEFYNSPDFIDTDLIDADRYSLLNFETSYRNGPLWVSSEFTPGYIKSTNENLRFQGFYLQMAYTLTGETRGYRKKTGTFDAVPVLKVLSKEV
jgi:phosphate-selective porin OprO/OprP